MAWPNVNKVLNAMRDFYDNRHSDPEAIAYAWAELPDDIQAPFFLTCVKYIELVSEAETFSTEMTINKGTAKRMLRWYKPM